MKKSFEKLKRLLQRGYRITGLQYYWNEDGDHYAMVYLFNKRDNLKTIEGKSEEGFEIIVYAREVLEKIGNSKKQMD